MRPFFSYGVKEIAAACLLSGCIAGGIVAMTSPGAAVAVDRSNKTDRLPQGATGQEFSGQPSAPSTQVSGQPSGQPSSQSAEQSSQQSKDNAAAPKSGSSRKGPPLGCDPAFSPVAEPDRAHVFNRCMV
jgi:hypothetical protein